MKLRVLSIGFYALLFGLFAPLGYGDIYVDVDVTPSPTTIGALGVERIELDFSDGSTRATVALNNSLQARAHIRYRGNGPLTGRWLVDNQPVAVFNRTLTFGSTLTLNSVNLPTFETGVHQVSIQFTTPPVSAVMPVLQYTVEAAPGASALHLIQPLSGVALTRARRDDLLGNGAGTLFTWRVPIGGLGLLGGVSGYSVTIYDALAPDQPLVNAKVIDPSYILPAVLAAQLPLQRELRWQVRALNVRGLVLATSEARPFTLRPASSITLIQPIEGAGLDQSNRLNWSSTSRFANFDVRAYANMDALHADLDTMLANYGKGAPAPIPIVSKNVLFQARDVKTNADVTSLVNSNTQPGMQVLWLVMGLDSAGNVREISELSNFILSPNVATLNGLPKALLIGGQEFTVNSYAQGATLEQLSGNGTLRFARDRTQRAIAFPFQNLTVEAFREQVRVTTGEGAAAKTVVQETLKGRVTAGRIVQNFTPVIALNLDNYNFELRNLTLIGGAAGIGGAAAELVLVLRDYADANGATPYRAVLSDVALEPGGDFYAVAAGANAGGLSSVNPLQSGLTLQGGALVVDFSQTNDYIAQDGQPVQRNGGVFLMGGVAQLQASALFAVTQAQTIALHYDALELKSGGFDGRLDVTGSDTITPVIPAAYRLRFKSGTLSLSNGQLQPGTLFLGGNVELPASVRTTSGSKPQAQFRDLRLINGRFIAPITVADLEWGGANGTPFRISEASGELHIPSGATTQWQEMGVRLTDGKLVSPLTHVDVAQVPTTTNTPSTATLSIPQRDAVALGNTNQLEAALNGDTFDLRIRTAGINGTLRDTAYYDGKIGDFNARFSAIALSFVDNAVTSSKLDGEVVIPKPSDLKLMFTDAQMSGSGEVMNPKLITPTQITLDYWRVKLVLPAQSAAITPPQQNIHLANAQTTSLASQTASDAPLMLAAAASGTPSTTTVPTTPPRTGIGSIAIQQPTTVPTLQLSRSFLRINGAQLHFLLDPKYGPVELDALQMQWVEIGSDGQVRNSGLRNLHSRFLQMDVNADSTSAIRFEPANGSQPAPGAALVSIEARIAFPTLGERHVTLVHTASGARADNLTPNGGGVGNPDLLRFDAANLVYHNGYAEGKGQFKEFVGSAQVSALKTLYLSGLTTVGSDTQGVYESVGLGIGVDPVRAVMLYSAGAVSVGAKLGAGAINAATAGKSTAEAEVTTLIGSIAELGAASTQDEQTQKMFKVLADAVTLAKRIHRDSGGKDGDTVTTLLGITGVLMNTASSLSNKEGMDHEKFIQTLGESLDLALGLVVQAKPDGRPMPPDAINAINLARVAIKAAQVTMDDGKLSRADWLDITQRLFTAAKGFSNDRTYQLVISLLLGTVEVAKSGDPSDPAVPLKLAAMTFKVVREANLVSSPPEAKDALILAQSIIDGLVLAGDAPNRVKAVRVTSHVLEVASGSDTNLGGGNNAHEIKKYLKLARRTVEAVGTMNEGISYQQAGREVQATLHDVAGVNNELYYTTVDMFVSAWVNIDVMNLEVSIGYLRDLVRCMNMNGCSESDLDSIMFNAVEDVESATTPKDVIAALGRIKAIQKSTSTTEFNTAFDWANRRQRVTTVAEQAMSRLASKINDSSVTTLAQVGAITRQTLSIAKLTTDIGLPISEAALTNANPFGTAKLSQLLQREIDLARQAPRFEDAAEHIRTIMAIERQAVLLGGETGVSVNGLVNLTNLRADLQNRIKSANTPEALQDAVVAAMGFERQLQLLGVDEGSNSNISMYRPPTQACGTEAEPILTTDLLLRYRQAQLLGSENIFSDQFLNCMLIKQYSRVLRLDHGQMTGVYEQVRRAVATATRIEDVDEAVALIGLFTLDTLPNGYSVDLRQAQYNTLLSLLRNRGTLLIDDAEARLEDLSGHERYTLAKRYLTLKAVIGGGTPNIDRHALNVFAQVPKYSCAGWKVARNRLEDPLLRKTPQYDAEIIATLNDLYERCLFTTEGDDPAEIYDEAKEKQMSALAEYMDDLLERHINGEPDALLKEELAWHLAQVVKEQTEAFKNNPRDGVQATLGRVHRQTDYMLRYRQKSAPERIIAGIELATDILKEIPGIDPAVREELQRVASGLKQFVKLGGAQREGVDMGIDLATGMAMAHAPQGPVQVLISMTRAGLLKARKPTEQTVNTNVPLLLAEMAAEGIKTAVETSGGAGFPPAVVSAVKLTQMLADFSDAMEEGKPEQLLTMAMDLVDEASELPALGRYIKPLVDPVPNLKAPDNDQQNYIINVLLAELAAARYDNPAHAGIPFKSTCQTFSPEQGGQFPAQLDADKVFVCALDSARETIANNMKGALDPNSAAGQAQRARAAVAGMRREAVYARTSGNDTLSGISGVLEYRNGQFPRFELISTFGMQGYFDVATKVSYSTQSNLLTLEKAANDGRDANILASLGLTAPGTNQLFGSDYFQDPVKGLYVSIGGPSACLNVRADLGMPTPLGAWPTSRYTLATCFNPFSFDVATASKGNYFLIIDTESRIHLFFNNGTGGLDVGASAGVYPELFGYGAFVDALADVGLGAGVTGLDACARVQARAGVTTPAQTAAACSGQFVPDRKICRNAASVGGDMRMGTDYRNFYLKAQSGIDFGIVYIGGWLYIAQTIDGGLLSRFPDDRYGGWSGATNISCGRL